MVRQVGIQFEPIENALCSEESQRLTINLDDITYCSLGCVSNSLRCLLILKGAHLWEVTVRTPPLKGWFSLVGSRGSVLTLTMVSGCVHWGQSIVWIGDCVSGV